MLAFVSQKNSTPSNCGKTSRMYLRSIILSTTCTCDVLYLLVRYLIFMQHAGRGLRPACHSRSVKTAESALELLAPPAAPYVSITSSVSLLKGKSSKSGIGRASSVMTGLVRARPNGLESRHSIPFTSLLQPLLRKSINAIFLRFGSNWRMLGSRHIHVSVLGI